MWPFNSSARNPPKENTLDAEGSTAKVDFISFFGGLLAIILAFVTLVVNTYELWTAAVPAATWYILVVNFFLLLGMCGLCVSLYGKQGRLLRFQRETDLVKLELRKRTEIHSEISRALEALIAHRTGITRSMYEIVLGRAYDHKVLRTDVKQFIDFLLNQTNTIFGAFTGHKTAACIKLFCEHESFDGPFVDKASRPQDVITFARDASSIHERGKTDRETLTQRYSYTSNTAFLEVMHNRSRDNYFYSNDLIGLAENQNYINSNPSWKHHYCATAVHAIKDPESAASEGVIGFLCADNRSGGFDDQFCKSTLALLAYTIYYVVRTTTILLQRFPEKVQEGITR